MGKIRVPRYSQSNGFIPTKKTSAIHSRIKSSNSKPEITFRKHLWQLGFRYRLGYKLIGKPDIVLPKYKIAIFVDGDFWHGYNWHVRKLKIKSNRGYWIPKIERNMQRDIEVNSELVQAGWTVLRFWEHAIKSNLKECASKVLLAIMR